MKSYEHITAIILCAGAGARMGLDYNKLLYSFKKPLIYYTINIFEQRKYVNNIILVVNKNDQKTFHNLVQKHSFTKVRHILTGGDTRQKSSYTVNKNDQKTFHNLVQKHSFTKVRHILTGGDTRQKSSYTGVHAANDGIVMIHDGAQPFVHPKDINNALSTLKENEGVTLAVPVKDTIKQTDKKM
ncbi:MAG: 2-C-methyl-D-erythritol 4-phosphate cytidylyltransferase [Candidatus Moranbacteria bacterium]|nr:2-C-methyl-D-erythritol 4-phosphate cytidylyltransferase [Candidatus Moranbacteria bacterium]